MFIALPILPAMAEENEPTVYQSGDFSYILLEDGTAEIVYYFQIEHSSEIVIPDELDGYVVSSIGDEAFSYRAYLQSVTIPGSVTSIGDNAFSICDSLQSVTISDGVISIGANPFYRCTKLKEINVSSTHPCLVVKDGVLFYKSEQETRLVTYPNALGAVEYCIPAGVTSIGDEAFYGCEKLESITIPDSVTSIGNAAFSSCRSLQSITIPDSVASIGANPFSSCSDLTEINVSSNHSCLEVMDGVLFFKSKDEIRLVTYSRTHKEKTEYSIPAGVTCIGDYAFDECHFLQSITIPDSITYIGDGAFYACRSLQSINIPDSVTSIGDDTFYACRFLQNIIIPDGITSIGDNAFSACKSLESINIPDSVTSIGVNAFQDCPSLTLTVTEGSYAETYAIENDIPYTY